MVIVGVVLVFTAGLGLFGKLAAREPTPVPKWQWLLIFDPTQLLSLAASLKYWHWKDDKVITVLFFVGLGLCVVGLLLS